VQRGGSALPLQLHHLCARGCVGMCGYAWAANDAATFVESFLLRIVNMPATATWLAG